MNSKVYEMFKHNLALYWNKIKMKNYHIEDLDSP